jgi:hypothetical protein
VLSGSPTFAGYIKLDDPATWFALTDRFMEHGHGIGGLLSSRWLRASAPSSQPSIPPCLLRHPRCHPRAAGFEV